MNTNKQSEKFLNSPSKLSSGNKNKRFKGSIASYTYLRACSDQSDSNTKFVDGEQHD